jgi:hypothetical protein
MNSPSTLTPNIIEEIIREQYSTFVAVAGKCASLHDQTQKANSQFQHYREKHFGIPKDESEIRADSFSKMAQFLVPSSTLNNQQSGNNTLKPSLFGNSTTQGTFGAIAAPKQGTSLFGSTKTQNTNGTTMGLFNSNTGTTVPSGGLFGSNAPQTNSLFGNTSNNAPAQTNSLFGNNAPVSVMSNNTNNGGNFATNPTNTGTNLFVNPAKRSNSTQ